MLECRRTQLPPLLLDGGVKISNPNVDRAVTERNAMRYTRKEDFLVAIDPLSLLSPSMPFGFQRKGFSDNSFNIDIYTFLEKRLSG